MALGPYPGKRAGSPSTGYGKAVCSGYCWLWAPMVFTTRAGCGPRAAQESMEPASYLGSGYFERWLRVTERALLDKGYLTLTELDQRTAELDARPDAVAPRREEPATTARMMQVVHTRSPSTQEGGRVPRFRSGDSARVRNLHPPGHTRLPRYVRGKLGVIASWHGNHDFHDAAPERATNLPQPVYSVRFEAKELWGEAA